jgi:hypothetical protein
MKVLSKVLWAVDINEDHSQRVLIGNHSTPCRGKRGRRILLSGDIGKIRKNRAG